MEFIILPSFSTGNIGELSESVGGQLVFTPDDGRSEPDPGFLNIPPSEVHVSRKVFRQNVLRNFFLFV
jgi:hypothetical protein